MRLHTQNQTQAEIIVQTGIPRNVLKKYIEMFKAGGLSFAEINELNDKDLEDLFAIQQEPVSEKMQVLLKYFPLVDRELRKKGVTIQLLWEEYIIKHPDGVSQSHFKRHLFRWKSRITPSMRKEHKAGDKLYIDFAGEKLAFTDRQTGEVKQVEVFVAILGASQLTYVQAVMSQKKEDFIPACEDALHYYGGVPAAIVPDNLRSAVTKSHKYEPTINETFADFAEHYNTTILPARVYKPKDKALVEIAINIIYTRIYAKIRDQKFYSIDEINQAIWLALEEHNNQLLTGRDFTRRQKFEEIERQTLLPLPTLRYEFKKQLYATVATHGHVALTADKHYYSVPYRFIGKKVKVMYTRYNVEVFYNYERIALHKRLKTAYNYTTDKEHLDPKHRFVSELSPEKFMTLAEDIHKDVKLYIIKILNKNHHPEKAYRVCLGVLNFAKKAGNERLTKACQRAMSYDCYDYNSIQKILEKGLDQVDEEKTEEKQMPAHENIRGGDYYK
ncbi:MAG: IS21 family transposase [Bacteroidetes bacterium]|nr:IS21 family transposase [Bacteroidota bacterium]